MSSHHVNLNTRIPVTPTLTAQASAPSPSGSQERASAFNAHLQQAHRHHDHARATSSRTDDADKTSDSETNDGKATDKASVTSAAGNGGDTKAGTDKASDSEAGATASLIGTVLGLIGQSSEEAGGSTATAATNAAANKLPVVLGQKPDDTPPAPVASMLLAAPAANATIPANIGGTNTLLSGPITAGVSSLLAGSADASDADSSDAADDMASGNSFDALSGSLPALNSASPGQDAIGMIFGTGHALGGVESNTTDAGATPSVRDLNALNGMLGTQGVGPSMGALPTTVHSLTVNAPVNSPNFSSELAQQVSWLGGQDIKQAKILLHPQDLGQLNVSVSIAHGKVDVVFLAQHPNAVAAVQQSLDQLSQMLNNQGLSLGQATVGQQGAQQHADGSSSGGTSRGDVGDDGIADAAITPVTQRLALGLVDAFA